MGAAGDMLTASLLELFDDKEAIVNELNGLGIPKVKFEAEVSTKASDARQGDFKLVCTFPEIVTRSASQFPAMYVFERTSGGYAVVSGDDVARPVLAYSLGGHFPVEDMPDNMRAMLQWYADVIEYARSQRWTSASPMSADSGLDPANSVQLQTAKWAQKTPFNDLVPEINGEKPPIGCVATAIAIVMKYYRWPLKGNGTLPSYDYGKIHIPGHALGHEYDWEKMLDNYRGCSAEGNAQIARLLYDIAVMCKMEFSPGGSDADLSSVRLLPEYFGYDDSIAWYSRGSGYYTDILWEHNVKEEIDAGRPVLYGGSDFGLGGHAFVIDGYNGRYFSINYGWGGATMSLPDHVSTGPFVDYYTLTPIDGHEEDLLVFSQGQRMYCRVMPDNEDVSEPNLMADGVNHLPPDFDINQAFPLHNTLINRSLSACRRSFRYVLFDKDGKEKEVISDEAIIDIPSDSGTPLRLDCKISSQLSEGDEIVLCVKDPGSGEWSQVLLLQDRFVRIIFTERPLADLVEIGYMPILKGSDGMNRDLYLKIYKDACWKLSGGGGIHIYGGNALDAKDKQCDTAYYEIGLPSGTYTLDLLNPATRERMKIKLEL